MLRGGRQGVVQARPGGYSRPSLPAANIVNFQIPAAPPPCLPLHLYVVCCSTVLAAVYPMLEDSISDLMFGVVARQMVARKEVRKTDFVINCPTYPFPASAAVLPTKNQIDREFLDAVASLAPTLLVSP